MKIIKIDGHSFIPDTTHSFLQNDRDNDYCETCGLNYYGYKKEGFTCKEFIKHNNMPALDAWKWWEKYKEGKKMKNSDLIYGKHICDNCKKSFNFLAHKLFYDKNICNKCCSTAIFEGKVFKGCLCVDKKGG